MNQGEFFRRGWELIEFKEGEVIRCDLEHTFNPRIGTVKHKLAWLPLHFAH